MTCPARSRSASCSAGLQRLELIDVGEQSGRANTRFDDPQGMYMRWMLPPAHLICTRQIYALGEFLGRDVDRQFAILG